MEAAVDEQVADALGVALGMPPDVGASAAAALTDFLRRCSYSGVGARTAARKPPPRAATTPWTSYLGVRSVVRPRLSITSTQAKARVAAAHAPQRRVWSARRHAAFFPRRSGASVCKYTRLCIMLPSSLRRLLRAEQASSASRAMHGFWEKSGANQPRASQLPLFCGRKSTLRPLPINLDGARRQRHSARNRGVRPGGPEHHSVAARASTGLHGAHPGRRARPHCDSLAPSTELASPFLLRAPRGAAPTGSRTTVGRRRAECEQQYERATMVS